MEYLKKNKELWEARTKIHVKSDFYDMESFKSGKSSLCQTELDLLGDISGKKILHLQCHFGQDSISLARLGAQVTGVDLSELAIKKANELANELDANCQFVCCDIFDLANHLDEKFDVVFTSYGVIGWLPELETWAKLINNYLKPNGEFLMVEFHPAIWMYSDDLKEVEHSYWNKKPICGKEEGSYANRDADINLEYVVYNHSLSEVIGSLLGEELSIQHFEEYDFSHYNCWADTHKIEERKYQIKKFDDKMPLMFSLKASK